MKTFLLSTAVAVLLAGLLNKKMNHYQEIQRQGENDYAAGNLQKDLVTLAKENGMGGDITIVTADGKEHHIRGRDYR